MRPGAIPMLPSIAFTQRFHRGGSSGIPERVLRLNSWSSWTKAFVSSGAEAERSCQRRYVFHVESGTDVSIAFAALKKSGCQTLMGTPAGTRWSRKYATHARLGVVRENASSVIGW